MERLQVDELVCDKDLLEVGEHAEVIPQARDTVVHRVEDTVREF